MKKLIFIIIMALGVAVNPAMAAGLRDSGVYVGAGGGYGHLTDSFCESFEDGAATLGAAGFPNAQLTECDQEELAWRIFAGYQFNSYFSAELEYSFTSNYRSEISGVTGFPGVTGDSLVYDSDLTTFGISGVARYPYSQSFAPFVRAGYHRWKRETDANVESQSTSDHDIDPMFAYGFEFRIRPEDDYRLRVEHARYYGNTADLDAFTVQLIFNL